MPPGIIGSSSLISTIALSVVNNIAEIEAAFCSADLVTLVGSTIPASIIFTYFSFRASNPIPWSELITFSTITEPSSPAFSAICLNGSSNALLIILTPVLSSPSVVSSKASTAGITFTRATPPPTTIPSSTAALVALRASSILSFLSFNYVSVAAPT